MTVYRVRRRRAPVGAVLALLVAYAACVEARHLLTGDGGMVNVDRAYGSAVAWPQQGQAALALGDGRPAASPHEQPAPIASLAKVMTAYLTLKGYPLSGAQDGFTITVTEDEARHVGAPGRRGRGRHAAGRVRRLSDPCAHDRRASAQN
jgi:hypothetical protein